MNKLLLLVAVLALHGCDRNCAEEKQIPPAAPAPVTVAASPAAPAVSGKWTGRWESSTHKGHGGGGLICNAKETAPGEWSAVFTAEFGKVKDYPMTLKGKSEGDKVVFGGEIDLGKEDGGVFTWTGRATATEFTGEYSGGGDKGTFKMARTEK